MKKYPRRWTPSVAAGALAFVVPAVYAPSLSVAQTDICTYTDWTWNSHKGVAQDHRDVEKPRSAVRPDERHPDLPCSICREDQVRISIGDVAPFFACQAVAADVERALLAAQDAGFSFETITGYRVGRTKGPLNERGQRSGYSNHSFGLAIDVNAARNGLYDQCIEFSDECRLIRGGAWRQGTAGTLSADGPVVREFATIGWQWGGVLAGRQKDFMHFSLTGD